jgi:hypothetical protein
VGWIILYQTTNYIPFTFLAFLESSTPKISENKASVSEAAKNEGNRVVAAGANKTNHQEIVGNKSLELF